MFLLNDDFKHSRKSHQSQTHSLFLLNVLTRLAQKDQIPLKFISIFFYFPFSYTTACRDKTKWCASKYFILKKFTKFYIYSNSKFNSKFEKIKILFTFKFRILHQKTKRGILIIWHVKLLHRINITLRYTSLYTCVFLISLYISYMFAIMQWTAYNTCIWCKCYRFVLPTFS